MLFSCYISLVMAGASSLWMDLGKTWPKTVVQLLRGDDGKKRGATAGHCSPWRGSRQKLFKRVGHDLVFARAMASLPWPAKPWCGITRVVWDVRVWCRMYGGGVGCTADWNSLVKCALLRRGMVAGRSPPYLRLRVHNFFWVFKETRPERRGVVAGQSPPYLRFRTHKRNNVDDVHEENQDGVVLDVGG